VLVVLLVVPGAALARHRTYHVFAGSPIAPPAHTPASTQLNRFFPQRIVIRKGDRINYANTWLHTISLLAKGQPRPAIPAPDPSGALYPAQNDAAGNPFFFSGKPRFIYNPLIFFPQGSHTIRNKKTEHNSGFVPSSPAHPLHYKLRFKKPGRYVILCLVHPGMKQIVRVKRHRRWSKAKVSRRIIRQSARGFADARAARKQNVAPPDTVYAGVEKRNAALIAFLPNHLTVPVGTTVTFSLASPSEVHNMVFGPRSYVDSFTAANDLIPAGPGSPNQFPGPYLFGTQPPDASGAYPHSQSTHGNGFEWTPLVAPAGSGPLGPTVKVRFTQAGTYRYFCGIHGRAMSGKVTVTG
jgi:plastocyanin